MKTNENYQDLESYTHRDITSENIAQSSLFVDLAPLWLAAWLSG